MLCAIGDSPRDPVHAIHLRNHHLPARLCFGLNLRLLHLRSNGNRRRSSPAGLLRFRLGSSPQVGRFDQT